MALKFAPPQVRTSERSMHEMADELSMVSTALLQIAEELGALRKLLEGRRDEAR